MASAGGAARRKRRCKVTKINPNSGEKVAPTPKFNISQVAPKELLSASLRLLNYWPAPTPVGGESGMNKG